MLGIITRIIKERNRGKRKDGNTNCQSHFYLFIYFIYFWLRWVFVAVHGLSLVVVSEGYSSLWCAGFSLRWLLVVEHGLWVRGLQ